MTKSQSVLAGVIAALVLAGAGACGGHDGTPILLHTDPDDRPPIIVSNGSIILQGTADSGGEAGSWVNDTSTKVDWYQDHKRGAPTRLDVLIVGSKTAGCASAGYFVEGIAKFEFTYKYGAASRTFSLDIQKGAVHVIAPTDSSPSNNQNVLMLESQTATLASLSLTTMSPKPVTITCEFDSTPSPHVYVLQVK